MKYLYMNKYWDPAKEYNLDKLLYLMVDRPNIIIYNDFIWKNKKLQHHRNYDLPADICYYDKLYISLSWYKNNKPHRNNNKPAIIYGNGNKQYWANGNLIKLEKLK